jgi:hypothetical protein
MLMAAPALKTFNDTPTQFVKNRLFITFPGYQQSHFCYASFYRNKYGRVVLRPVLSKEDRPHAELIHTTLWNEGSQVATCYGSYIDCDAGRARGDKLLRGRISEEKLRQRLDELLGEASKYFRLVRSRSGKGIHVWFFFPGFKISEETEEMAGWLKNLQSALIHALEHFGADQNSTGIERWGMNWRNPKYAIDNDCDDLRASFSRNLGEKPDVLRAIYHALKDNLEVRHIVNRPLLKWYPDYRVSHKVTCLVADHFEDIVTGKDVVLKRKDLLSSLSISTKTLPFLLSEPVGPDNKDLKGIRIQKDLERYGYYRISAKDDLWRLQHMAENLIAERKASARKKKTERKGQAIMMFEPTKKPERVQDGERNYSISHVYLKLKWHGCTLETAQRIVDAYVSRIPGKPQSSTASRHKAKGRNIYKRFDNNIGCKPGIAEDWLLALSSNKGSSKASSNCSKSLKENYCAPPSGQKEKSPPPPQAFRSQGVGSEAPRRNEASEAKVVRMEDWLRKASASSVVRNLARTMDLKASASSSAASDAALSKRLEGKSPAQTAPEVPLSTRLSKLIMNDERLTREQKAATLSRVSLLLAESRMADLAALSRKLGWSITIPTQ